MPQLNKDYYIKPRTRYELARVMWINRSKYTPHQGKQECARRLRQMQRA